MIVKALGLRQLRQLTRERWPGFHPQPSCSSYPGAKHDLAVDLTSWGWRPSWAHLLIQLSWGGLLGVWITWAGISSVAAQTAPQTWSGTGQIVNGQGQGATVQLMLEMGDGRIRTRSGPTLNAPYSGGQTTVNTEEGLWQIEPQGNKLSVTLHRGDQIIRYQLYPNAQQAPTRLIPQSPSQSRPGQPEVIQPQQFGGGAPRIRDLILGN